MDIDPHGRRHPPCRAAVHKAHASIPLKLIFPERSAVSRNWTRPLSISGGVVTFGSLLKDGGAGTTPASGGAGTDPLADLVVVTRSPGVPEDAPIPPMTVRDSHI